MADTNPVPEPPEGPPDDNTENSPPGPPPDNASTDYDDSDSTGYDSTDSASTDSAAHEPEPLSPSATMFEQLGTLLDGVQQTERAKRAATAAQVVAIEKARQHAEALQQATPEELAKTHSVRFVSDDLAWRSFEAEVGLALQLPDMTARRLIQDAYTLTAELPGTLSALSDGAISYRHATKMIEHTTGLDPASMLLFEAAALPRAAELTPTKFGHFARKLRQKLDPIELEERHRTAYEKRELVLEPNQDAMATLTLYVSAVDGVAIQDRLWGIADNLKKVPGEERTLTQLRADTAVMLLQEGDLYPREASTAEDGSTATTTSADDAGSSTADAVAASGDPVTDAPTHRRGIGPFAGITPTVMVTVPALAILDAVNGREIGDHGPATLEGYGPIPMDQALALAGTAKSFIRLLTDPETGTVLSIGRDRYRPPTDLGRWITYRDETCRKPNCNCSAHRSDIDHTIAWAAGGNTAYDNLAAQCPPDHTLKHAMTTDGTIASDGEPMTTGTAWKVEHELDEHGRSTGVLIWRTPSGREYISRPSVELAPPPVAIRPPSPDDELPFAS